MMPPLHHSTEQELDWKNNPRWDGVVRDYVIQDVERLQGSIGIEHTLAKRGAEVLWKLLKTEPYVRSLGAMTGNQAIQMADAGLRAIYVSGWQVAADANLAGQMYPDQSLYPSNSMPTLVRAINNALLRADQIQWMEQYSGKRATTEELANEAKAWDDGVIKPTDKGWTKSPHGGRGVDYLIPLVADGEAGFGGVLNVFELTKALIEAGAAAIHFEDQLASEKKCGHLSGKVLVPASQFIRTLKAARLAADVMNVPTIIIARTDALSAKLITSNTDDGYRPFDKDSEDWASETWSGVVREDTFYDLDPRLGRGLIRCINRSLAYAPYADLLWFETSEPNIEEAIIFADAIHKKYPGKMLAYNCSPSFSWSSKLNQKEIADFHKELAEYNYKFLFVTLAGFHSLNFSMFDLALDYKFRGMEAYVNLQDNEFDLEKEDGYRAIKHQRFVGTGYFDEVGKVINGNNSITALKGSTEDEQF